MGSKSTVKVNTNLRREAILKGLSIKMKRLTGNWSIRMASDTMEVSRICGDMVSDNTTIWMAASKKATG